MRYEITDVIRFIFEVERGEKKITPTEDPNNIFAGNCEYTTDDGWKIVVFNDCASFDYIDSITDPSGYKWTTPDSRIEGWSGPEFFFQYDPPKDVVKNIYGIYYKSADEWAV